MLLINKINATIRCYDLNQYAGYNLYAHPFWLKLQKETIIKKIYKWNHTIGKNWFH